jgi:hypothetical protein
MQFVEPPARGLAQLWHSSPLGVDSRHHALTGASPKLPTSRQRTKATGETAFHVQVRMIG